ncbi:hypothetical protein [Mucilaginibacter sp.]|uniref:hypothetical protein n=1 Tax=Mucilaginibacter sp. TaxID=1882438 RepID=UPI0035BBB272
MGKQEILFPLPEPRVIKEFVPAGKILSDEQIKADQRRYRWHKALIGVFPVDGTNRSVDVTPYASITEIPKPHRYYVHQLFKAGYRIQYGLNLQ